MKILNEYRMISMKRTGHHAIEYWIRDGFFEPRLAVFHAEFYKGSSVACRDKNISYNEINNKFKLFHNQDINLVLYDFQQVDLNELHGGKLKIPKIIYDIWPESKHFEILNQKILLVVRDPFNWLASMMKKWPHTNKICIEIYKQHLKQALGIKNFFGNYPYITINYNQWFKDLEYREKIAKDLNMKNNPKLTMSPNGGGSSFDGMKLNKNPEQLQTTKRWEQFKDNKRYLSLLDQEIRKLSEDLFNFNPLN